jgi:hypothetical protein
VRFKGGADVKVIWDRDQQRNQEPAKLHGMLEELAIESGCALRCDMRYLDSGSLEETYSLGEYRPKTPPAFIRLSPTECVRRSEIISVRDGGYMETNGNQHGCIVLELRGVGSFPVELESRAAGAELAKRLCDELAGVKS